MGSPNSVSLELIRGSIAPRYPQSIKELTITNVVITEQGTQGGWPIVDLQMVDSNGNEYFAMVTGQIVNTISAAIKGVNVRNHGREEP